jgi:branched-chain amino acid aminotransferase
VTRLVAIDGNIVTPSEATISVYDRGFLYGDSVFEVLRTYRGVPFALGEHVARLRRSAERVLIRVPLDDAAFADEIARIIAAAANPESYARIMLTRGSGPLGLDPDLATSPLRVILVEPVVPPSRAAYANGIAACTVVVKRAVDDTSAAGAKVSNYLASLLALHDAKARGGAEALIVDARGRVIEGATSNVFVVRGSSLCTPPESAGILAGITRAEILEAARALGIEVEMVDLVPADLERADEVFITSSIREVVPVVKVDGHTIGSGTPGPVTRALHRALRQRVGLGDRAMPWE